MKRSAILIVAVLLLAAAGAAAARDDTPAQLADYARLPVCTLGADGKSLAVEPCRTAPFKQAMPRRPVRQIVGNQPSAPPATTGAATATAASTATAAPAQGRLPAATPGAPLTAPVNVPVKAPLPAYQLPRGAPLPTGGCDSAGCYGADGRRYNSAGPGTLIGPAGRVCSRNGAVVQC